MPFGVSVHLTYFLQMTNLSTAAAGILDEFAGGTTGDFDMMVGVGLVKDTDAVFFEYLGDDSEPAALMLRSGKALTRMSNVQLAGISIAEDIGEFNSTKLNLLLRTSAGRTILVTSGLTTIWSQCVVTSLMAMYNGGDVTCPFHLDTWKGTSKMRPCFAAIRVGQTKMSDNDLYEQLRDARSDGDKSKVQSIMRDSVEILNHAVTGGVVNDVSVTVAPALPEADSDLF